MEDIESQVDQLGVSSLVVPLGGLGATYPSFVTNNASLQYTINAAAEEWLHQYLTFKPLGFLYLLHVTDISKNYEVVTINETLASMVSKEIGAILYEKYYPGYTNNGDNGATEPEFDFNEEPVARAIFDCKTPLVSAVGHEIDYTIADFVADLRAPTPSAAAELVVRERESIVSEVAQLRNSLARSVTTYLTELDHRLQLVLSSYGFRRPPDMLVQYEQQLDDARERMFELQERYLGDLDLKISTAQKRLFAIRPNRFLDPLYDRLGSATRMLGERIGNAIAQCEASMGELAAKLDSLSPLAVLARGYSIAYHGKEILKDSSRVSLGDRVSVKLHKGTLGCVVENVED